FSFTAHARDVYQESLNPGGLLARKLQAARFAVTCTAANRAHLARLANGVRVHCVYHGLTADVASLLARNPTRRLAPRTSVRALGVGRLVRKKGFDVLVEACARLRAEGVAIAATIAGEDGEHGAELRHRVKARGLGDAVRFTGPLGQEALFREYRR